MDNIKYQTYQESFKLLKNKPSFQVLWKSLEAHTVGRTGMAPSILLRKQKSKLVTFQSYMIDNLWYMYIGRNTPWTGCQSVTGTHHSSTHSYLGGIYNLQ